MTDVHSLNDDVPDGAREPSAVSDRAFGHRSSRRAFLGAAAGAALVSAVDLAGAGPAGAAIRRSSRARAANSKALTVALYQTPDSLDPAATALVDVETIACNVFDNLVCRPAGSSKFFPGLATSWEISPDATKYTFKLRRGVTFHDGTPFNAHAVKATYDHIVAPATKSAAAAGQVGSYAGTKVLDEYTAQISFKTPNSGFLNEITLLPGFISSPAAIKKYGANYHNHPVGTGPFMFKEYVTGQSISLVRNPHYNWGPAFLSHKGPARVEELTIRILTDPEARSSALQSGEVQLAENLNPQDVASLTASGRYTENGVTTVGVGYTLPINVTKSPTDDLGVRQALLYATDQASIVKTLFFGVFSPSHQAFSTGSLAYDSSLDALYSYNPTKAGSLLDAAGWTMGSGGVRMKSGVPLTLDVINIANFGFDGITQLLQAAWGKLGIQMTISDQSFPSVATTYNTGTQNIADFFYLDADPASCARAVFGSGSIKSGFNWAHFSNAQLDSLVTKAEATTKPQTQDSMYKAISKIVMDNAAILPIYNPRSSYTGLKTLSGLKYNQAGCLYLHDATLA